jgi:hypothetical protein
MIGTSFSLLHAGVNGEHDGVELVQGRASHDMTDVREILPSAFKLGRCASLITANSNNRGHHGHGCCNGCAQ